MKNPLNGTAQPALSEMGLMEKTRTYRTPNGGSFQVTESEFAEIVAIFDVLRKWRDEKSTQIDIEPQETGSQNNDDAINSKKVG